MTPSAMAGSDGNGPAPLGATASSPVASPTLPLSAVRDVRRAVRFTVCGLADSYGADSEDIAQEVLLALLTAHRLGRLPDRPAAWAQTVARRRAWKSDMDRRREVPIGGPGELDLVSSASGERGDEMADLTVQRHRLVGWIRDLPPEVRAVMALRMDGYSDSEIARDLRMSRSLVKVHAREGTERLRAALVGQMAAEMAAEQAERRAEQAETRQAGPVPVCPAPAAPPPSEDRALAGLPPRQKEVLRLSRRGYTPAQIARLLGLSANTARVNLYHARKRVRRDLGLLDDRRPDDAGPRAGRA
ncbi:sigma-70 family RNA polymerase sigma factor [Spongiactinospora gelatinilytica]|nr:sigma-70 family RNA polymerase sigma factor [Spongiactinospora gelatinilytica]